MNKEFITHYQPKVNIHTGAVTGLDCDEFQGYFYSKPLPTELIEEKLGI